MRSASVLRAVDANANRAREGLRVCEDLLRFALGSGTRFEALRGIRHDLTRELARLPVKPVELVAARDSRRDPGRRAAAAPAASVEQLLLINFQRTKEALRVLEEASRLIAPRRAASFQALRFRTYDAERDFLLALAAVRHSRSRRG